MISRRFFSLHLSRSGKIVIFLAVLLLLGVAAARWPRPSPLAKIEIAMDKVRPLHRPMGPVQPGDWLQHHTEPGQTFKQYRDTWSVAPQQQRQVIYMLVLGDLSPKQEVVFRLTGEYLAACYDRPVKVLSSIPLSAVDATGRRVSPKWETPQISSMYVIDKLLPSRLPDDGAALIALTASDLWPGNERNRVYGQASYINRVGVWSMYGHGDPATSDEAFRLCLRRTLKTAGHEVAHMFSIRHCIAYECNMCGVNNRAEVDRRPLAFCPECAAKVWWATGADPEEHYRKLAEFCERQGLEEDASSTNIHSRP